MPVQWSDDFATGVDQVDQQHRRLFSILDDFEVRMNRKENANTLISVLHDLNNYTREHFAYEEGCMDRCICTSACVNKMAHQRFLRMVDQYLQACKTGTPDRGLFESLHNELVDWLKSHICKIDTSLRKHARAL